MHDLNKFRRLLQDANTGLYYVSKGIWTSNSLEAHDFNDCGTAVKAGMALKLNSLHLVLKFPDSKMDVVHPLKEIHSDPRRSDSL